MEENKVTLKTPEQESQMTFEEIMDQNSAIPEESKEKLTEAKNKLTESLGFEIPEETLIQIFSLLLLPDERFSVIADEFIKIFEAQFATTESKIAITQSLVSAGVKMEDVIVANDRWNIMVDEALLPEVGPLKAQFLKQIFGTVTNIIMESSTVGKRLVQIPIVIFDGGKVPTYANIFDAGADVYAIEDTVIEPGETKIVRTGITIDVPRGYEIQIRPRSGLSLTSKLRIANAPGTIDNGYKDEVGIICENIEPRIKDIHIEYVDGKPNLLGVDYGTPIYINAGQRIAQMVLNEIPIMNFYGVEYLDEENDRGGGFGSTDQEGTPKVEVEESGEN